MRTKTASAKTGLLRLPPELRNDIYKSVARSDHVYVPRKIIRRTVKTPDNKYDYIHVISKNSGKICSAELFNEYRGILEKDILEIRQAVPVMVLNFNFRPFRHFLQSIVKQDLQKLDRFFSSPDADLEGAHFTICLRFDQLYPRDGPRGLQDWLRWCNKLEASTGRLLRAFYRVDFVHDDNTKAELYAIVRQHDFDSVTHGQYDHVLSALTWGLADEYVPHDSRTAPFVELGRFMEEADYDDYERDPV